MTGRRSSEDQPSDKHPESRQPQRFDRHEDRDEYDVQDPLTSRTRLRNRP
jgi:hypothetical protein